MSYMQLTAMTLVFSAIVAITYVLYYIVFADLNKENSPNPDSTGTPVERFISIRKLKKLRYCASFFAAWFIICILLCANVLSLAVWAVALTLLCCLASYAPLAYFRFKVHRREEAFRRQLLDLVMGLNNGLKAGMALPHAFEIVGRDIGGTMQEEIGHMLHEYRLGMELSQAMIRLEQRMPDENLKLLSTAVRLSQQTGGSLSEILDGIIDTIRQRSAFQDKIKTLVAQGKFEAIVMAAAPLMAFVILYFLDPALMVPLVTTGMGWLALGVVGVLECIGFFIINKIVSIDM